MCDDGRASERDREHEMSPSPKPQYLTTEQVAKMFGIDPEALRARARRAARREGRTIVARLGAGVTAVKFGPHWRFRVVVVE